MSVQKQVNPYVKSVVRKSVRDKVVDVLESTDVLDDDDLAHILESLLERGWKLEDGSWRKVR
jgi:transcription initiation factor IIE alpha subunit